MSLRFFTDHCVPNYKIQLLQNEGYEIFKLRDFLPKDSDDKLVILKAQEHNSILISLNGDFADIITYPPENYKGIIALQVRNHPEVIPHLMTKLKDYLINNSQMDYYNGKLILVEAHRIRIWE